MPRFQTPTFKNIAQQALIGEVERLKKAGFRFVQICATTLDDSCELLYAFTDPDAEQPGLVGLVVNVADGMHLRSITQFYPAAFVFENEIHDLFGVDIDGINIDFDGQFYTVSQPYPMNPRALSWHESQGQSVDGKVYGDGARQEAVHE